MSFEIKTEVLGEMEAQIFGEYGEFYLPPEKFPEVFKGDTPLIEKFSRLFPKGCYFGVRFYDTSNKKGGGERLYIAAESRIKKIQLATLAARN